VELLRDVQDLTIGAGLRIVEVVDGVGGTLDRGDHQQPTQEPAHGEYRPPGGAEAKQEHRKERNGRPKRTRCRRLGGQRRLRRRL
jgi:hypothetical protein